MWRLSPRWHDDQALAHAWRTADPFPHLVFDDFVPDESVPELLAIVDEEPIERFEADIYAFEASLPEPKTDGLRRLRDAFTNTLAPPLSKLTAKPLRCACKGASSGGASPRQARALGSVTERNRVAARRGGEQLEVNRWSAT